MDKEGDRAIFVQAGLNASESPAGGIAMSMPMRRASIRVWLALAMHVCRRVDIYGFSGKSSHYYTKTAAKKSDSTQFNMRHPWPLERACLKSLSKLDGVTVWS